MRILRGDWGEIPMEEMDLYVHPSRNELLPMHPEGPIMSLKSKFYKISPAK